LRIPAVSDTVESASSLSTESKDAHHHQTEGVMANGNGVSLETVHQELEKLGSIIRGLSTQIASVRVRVSDLERWDIGLGAPGTGRAELKLMSKRPRKKSTSKKSRKAAGKKPAKSPAKRRGSKSRR
jgi:hypothetical protein